MFSKIIGLVALALLNVGVNSAPGATSYSSISGHVKHESSISHVVPVVHASPKPVHHPVNHASPIVHVAPVVHATPVAHIVAPIASPIIKKEVYADIPAQYSFEYGVQDSHTGDIKKHHEERNGDVVKGFYTLVQPDGVTRIVHYTSDAHHGFNANVEYKGSPVVQKTIVPVKVEVAAPVHHAYHH